MTETRKARELEAKKTLFERQSRPTSREELWESWVPAYIAARYSARPKTLISFNCAWRNLAMFLDERAVLMPRQLTRAHCFDYLTWRKVADVANQKYHAGHNTALAEIKWLGLIMKEAVLRQYAPFNPARELGIQKVARRLYPEYSDAELQIISAAIEREPVARRAFLYPSFMLARYHGVRLIETHLNPMTDVNLAEGTICFHQKGGKVRTKPLHPALVPLFREFQAQGATETFPMPKSFAKDWFRFLHQAGIKARNPNACFHSLRVTVKSRLRRAGIGKELAMEYLSHEAGDVDESYNRFTLDDLRQCHRALT